MRAATAASADVRGRAAAPADMRPATAASADMRPDAAATMDCPSVAVPAAPAVPAITAAPAVTAPPGVSTPVKAGTAPAVVVPAVLPTAENELSLLNIAGDGGVSQPARRPRQCRPRDQGANAQREPYDARMNPVTHDKSSLDGPSAHHAQCSAPANSSNRKNGNDAVQQAGDIPGVDEPRVLNGILSLCRRSRHSEAKAPIPVCDTNAKTQCTLSVDNGLCGLATVNPSRLTDNFLSACSACPTSVGVRPDALQSHLWLQNNWCRRRDLNPRPPAYEADALPLSYAGTGR